MSPDQKYAVVDHPLCLEEGQRYEIVVSLDRYDQVRKRKQHKFSC